MITEKLTAATTKTATPDTVSPPFVAEKTGVKYCGTCQPAQRTPRITVPTSGPQRSCRRGSANPRHPGSSSLYKSPDAGQTWTQVTNQQADAQFAVVMRVLDPKTAWERIQFVDRTGLAITNDGGLHWTRVLVPKPGE